MSDKLLQILSLPNICGMLDLGFGFAMGSDSMHVPLQGRALTWWCQGQAVCPACCITCE